MALQAAEKVGLANLSVRLTNLEVARSPTLCHPSTALPPDFLSGFGGAGEFHAVFKEDRTRGHF
jgi:hypothetical protein